MAISPAGVPGVSAGAAVGVYRKRPTPPLFSPSSSDKTKIPFPESGQPDSRTYTALKDKDYKYTIHKHKGNKFRNTTYSKREYYTSTLHTECIRYINTIPVRIIDICHSTLHTIELGT